MKVLLFCTGGNVVYAQQTARAYFEAGMLDKYYVTFAYRENNLLGKFLKALFSIFSSEQELHRRKITEIPDYMLVDYPFWEIARTISSKISGPKLTDRIWEISEHNFGKFVKRHIKRNVLAVHGYEHGSLETFIEAKKMGIKTIYEMPAPFHKTTSSILEKEYKKHPETITVYKRYTDKLTLRRNKRREEELQLADIVICNSSFTKKSLILGNVPEEKIIVVPYGMPSRKENTTSLQKDKKMTFLYVGTMSVRKGAHYLLEAWRNLPIYENIQLKMFGANLLPDKLFNSLPGRVNICSTITKEKLYDEYGKADILIFPTLCDGFGMVLTEALANGCPVLTTNNAGSSDFIEDGKNGFIVSAGDSKAILEKITWCIENRDKLRVMKKNCVLNTRIWSWGDYRREISKKVAALLRSVS